MLSRKGLLFAGAALGAALLTGCASSAPSSPPASDPTDVPAPASSASPSSAPTALASWTGSDAGEPRLAIYPDGELYGFDGCNPFGGTYERDGDELTLTLGYGTLKACVGIDMWLRDAATATVVGDVLEVFDAAGAQIGTLEAD